MYIQFLKQYKQVYFEDCKERMSGSVHYYQFVQTCAWSDQDEKKFNLHSKTKQVLR